MKIQLSDPFLDLINKKARYKIFHGGRGSGKSYNVGLALLLKARSEKIRILCTREIQRTIRDSVHKLFSDAIERHGFNDFEIQREGIFNRVTGSELIFKGLRGNPQEIKSLEGVDIAWVEEAHSVTHESLNVLLPTIRKDNSEIWVTFNRVKLKDPAYEVFVENERPNSIVKMVNYYDNPWFPKVLRDEMEYDKEHNTGLYMHKWMGEPMQDFAGSLWNYDLIKYREACVMQRVVVAIDPAVSTQENSDETGIVVCGKGADGLYYTIEDLSGKYTPNEWARVADNAYKRHKADLVVAEKNQGGDLVSHNLRTVNQNLPIKLVHATKGKYVRAEPVAALYEQGKVFHVEALTHLENQMVSFKVDSDRKKNGSPDRVDALVWGFTELALNQEVRIRRLN